jgi:hypothetical protein
MMVHLDQGTSTANIRETFVTKYAFSQNSRRGQKGGGVGGYTNETNSETYSTKIFTHLHGKQNFITGSFKLKINPVPITHED